MKRLILLFAATLLLMPINAAIAEIKEGDNVAIKLGRDQFGQNIDMEDLLGKTVVIYFWNPYCEECLLSLEQLEDIQKRFPDHQLEVVAIAILTEAKDYKRIKKKLVNFESLYIYDKSGRTARHFDVYKPSNLFIVDEAGTLRYIKRDYKEETKDKLLSQVSKLVSGS